MGMGTLYLIFGIVVVGLAYVLDNKKRSLLFLVAAFIFALPPVITIISWGGFSVTEKVVIVDVKLSDHIEIGVNPIITYSNGKKVSEVKMNDTESTFTHAIGKGDTLMLTKKFFGLYQFSDVKQ